MKVILITLLLPALCFADPATDSKIAAAEHLTDLSFARFDELRKVLKRAQDGDEAFDEEISTLMVDYVAMVTDSLATKDYAGMKEKNEALRLRCLVLMKKMDRRAKDRDAARGKYQLHLIP